MGPTVGCYCFQKATRLLGESRKLRNSRQRMGLAVGRTVGKMVEKMVGRMAGRMAESMAESMVERMDFF